MTVTVIIPTYNRAEFLPASLISIAKQTRPADQVIVVDDGSTGNTQPLVQDVFREWFPQKRWPFVRYIRRQKNEGKSVAANEGIAEAQADLLWIFDDDDLADPGRLERLVSEFEQDETLGLVHTDAEWFRGENEEKKLSAWKAESFPQDHILRRLLVGSCFFGISVMFRHSLMVDLAMLETDVRQPTWPFDEKLERAQDYDLWIRLAYAARQSQYKIRAINQVTVRARNHPGRRGIGHRLFPQDLDRVTLECERKIIVKVLSSIPTETIWPGYPEEPMKQIAHLERAHALYLRELNAEALGELRYVDDPERLDVLSAVNLVRFYHLATKRGWPDGIHRLEEIAKYVRRDVLGQAWDILEGKFRKGSKADAAVSFM